MAVALNCPEQRRCPSDLPQKRLIEDTVIGSPAKRFGEPKELAPRFLDGCRVPAICVVDRGDVSVVECACDWQRAHVRSRESSRNVVGRSSSAVPKSLWRTDAVGARAAAVQFQLISRESSSSHESGSPKTRRR